MNPNTRDLVNREEPRRSNNPPSGSLVSFDNMEEEWRDVVGYEGLYEVSSLGRVRRVPGLVWQKNGKPYNIRKYRILKGTPDKDGYLQVMPCINGIPRMRKIHRLVATAFILNPEDKPQVNHINGIIDDNRVDNLEWTTCSENVKHSFNILLRRPTWTGIFGAENPNSRPVFRFSLDGSFLCKHDGIAAAARDTGVRREGIRDACHGRIGMAGGYMWGFYKNSITKPYIDTRLKPVIQYNLNGQFISIFKSSKEASRITNINSSRITGCCVGRRGYNTAGGYIWRYE